MVEESVNTTVQHVGDLFSAADRQAGYFTATEALVLGYTYPLQSYHKARGHWLDMGWGLYRLRDYPVSDDEELVRLSLWSRNRQGEAQAIVSHDTALRLYGLSDLLPNKIHLSVPKGFRKVALPNVVLHKTALAAGDSRLQRGYRVTTPLQTLLDVASSPLSPELLEQVVGEALAQGLVRRKRLLEALGELKQEPRSRLAQALATHP